MSEIIYFIVSKTFWLFVLTPALGWIGYLVARKFYPAKISAAITAGLLLLISMFVLPAAISRALRLQSSLVTFGPMDGPAIPFKNVLSFLKKFGAMERVADIARDPNDVPPPIGYRPPRLVKINLETKEVISEIAPGIKFNYWTFNGTVPGPFLRVRSGDTVELTLTNHPSSVNHHNIDLHAVTGPGGGASLTNVAPGETKTMTFKAMNPGLYVYHCAHSNPGTHMAHGMYGLILVEPEDGLPEVDKEFYVMQGEFYGSDEIGGRGLQIFDAWKMIDGKPDYVVFNGKINSLANMKAEVGDRIRIFFGNGGVNLHSAFHVIGEIFDEVYPEASIGGSLLRNVQTTLVPAGGAAIADFRAEVPGKFALVDHALARLDRGAWGVLEVSGKPNEEIFRGESDSHSHAHVH